MQFCLVTYVRIGNFLSIYQVITLPNFKIITLANYPTITFVSL